jgi:hypothetical protein
MRFRSGGKARESIRSGELYKVLVGLLSSPSNVALGVSMLFLLITMGGCKPWLHADRIDTDGFESVRSAISPDIEELFDEAEQEFTHGEYWYDYRQSIDMESAYERYGVLNLYIIQFEEEDGAVYEVLFAYTSSVRGFGGGYYYTPSDTLPPWAPNKGVVCSRHMDGSWYAFNTVDSRTPPSSKACPEDTQYQ